LPARRLGSPSHATPSPHPLPPSPFDSSSFSPQVPSRFASPRLKPPCRQHADRPPSSADATSARRLGPSSLRHACRARHLAGWVLTRDHMLRWTHLAVYKTTFPSFVRVLIALSSLTSRSPCQPRLFLLSHRTSNVATLFDPAPAVAPWVTIHLLPSIWTSNAFQYRPAGLSPTRLTSHSFSSLVLPSSAHTTCSILVSTTLDSPINTPSLASPKLGSRGQLSIHLYPRLHALRLPTDRLTDDKPCQRAIIRHLTYDLATQRFL